MPRTPQRYSVKVTRRSGYGISGTSRSFSRKVEAIKYARTRRNKVTVVDNRTGDVVFPRN